MHFYRTYSHPAEASRIFHGALRASFCAAVALGGCAKYAQQPELNPGAWAPQAVQREWAPAPGQYGLVGSAAEVAGLSDRPPNGQWLGLTELIRAVARCVEVVERSRDVEHDFLHSAI